MYYKIHIAQGSTSWAMNFNGVPTLKELLAAVKGRDGDLTGYTDVITTILNQYWGDHLTRGLVPGETRRSSIKDAVITVEGAAFLDEAYPSIGLGNKLYLWEGSQGCAFALAPNYETAENNVLTVYARNANVGIGAAQKALGKFVNEVKVIVISSPTAYVRLETTP